MYQLIKAGTGKVTAFCKASDTATSVAGSPTSYFARDASGQTDDKRNKAVVSFSEMRGEPREDVADEFWRDRARIFDISESMLNSYKVCEVALFVLYTESGLAGPDFLDYREIVGRLCANPPTIVVHL